jgi:hypothetical protein
MRLIQRCQICRAEYYESPVCSHSTDEWDRYLDQDRFAGPQLSRRERRQKAKAERSTKPHPRSP